MVNLRRMLYAWRDQEAAKRGVELFRVLPNQALDEIVRSLPRTKEELTAIKGIKEAKYREYGKALLAMVDESVGASHKTQVSSSKLQVPSDSSQDTSGKSQEDSLETKDLQLATAYSVSDYLDIVNRELYRVHARVTGEVTSIKFQGSAVYIGLKDAADDSTLSVFMWARDYTLSGAEVTEGMEVIVEGRSEIYKPSGRFSFRAETIELAGEGALKKAYDALKKKLDAEGTFAPEKKRALAEFPERIGLITSKQGAVIHDFLNNLGKFGFTVRFVDSRVEGAAAVKDILSAIKYFATEEIDTLVLIRGGGSLESLQAFNNERVVRAIAEFPKPTIVAIGHDKDVPLAQLAADHAPSTPTAATVLINRSWEEGFHAVRYFARDIVGLYEKQLWGEREVLRSTDEGLRRMFAEIVGRFSRLADEFRTAIIRLERALGEVAGALTHATEFLAIRFTTALRETTATLSESSRMLTLYNPLRQLDLGYSILSKKGKIVRSTKELPHGTHFEARLADGTLEAQVK